MSLSEEANRVNDEPSDFQYMNTTSDEMMTNKHELMSIIEEIDLLRAPGSEGIGRACIGLCRSYVLA